MADTYTYEQKLAFVKSLYCPARQCADESGCSWELILAQAAQETGWGEKILPGTNNIFNIKATQDWNGEAKTFNVWEKVAGNKVWGNASFRVYPTILDSLRDRQKFLKENSRYAKAGLYNDDVKGNLVKEAEALKLGGYATDEGYATKLKDVYDGPTMQRAIAASKKDGCKGRLPTINVYIQDAARVALANTKVKASQGGNTCALVTDSTGHVQVQAALSGGQVSIDVWSEQDHKWIAIEEKITPTSPPTAVTLVSPTVVVNSSTESHESAPDHVGSGALGASGASATSKKSIPAHGNSGHNTAHPEVKSYTVKKGDSLSKIAKAYSTSYLTLARLNGITSPYYVYPGHILKVPKPPHSTTSSAVSGLSPAAATPAAQQSSPSQTHRPGNEIHTVGYRSEADHPRTDVLNARRAPWMAVAEHEFQAGVRRRGGANPDQHIEEYFSATSLGRQHSDNLAYCAAFVNWCLTRAGFRGNNSAGANSLSTWGRSTRGNKPAYGAIAVVRFPAGGHHVTFVNGNAAAGQNASRIATLGGNQGHAHEVSHSAVPASWVTHYRFPVDYVENDEDYNLEQANVDSAKMSASSTH